MVIDAHQHVWDLRRSAYAWTEERGPLHRTFALEALLPDLAACGVDRTVLVQAEDSAADTDLMLETADRYPAWSPASSAGCRWAPRRAQGELPRRLAHPRFCGVRHLIHDDPDPDWLRRPAVLDGLRMLAEHDVPFDVVAELPRHLEHVPFLRAEIPGLRLVIDHLAKPPIAAGGWQPWADPDRRGGRGRRVREVSGLNTAADHANWSADDLRPYVQHALECFGAERLMFGGDWPVALLAGDYPKVFRETMWLLEGWPAADRERVLSGTASEFYGLG